MATAEGLPVSLEPNSLYVSTIPLTHGFHYALVHVDRHGSATRHHWAAISIDPHGPEGYVGQPMPAGPRMKAGQQQILGYFKLLPDPASAPGPGAGPGVDAAALRAACAAVFPRSAPSALQNRAANRNSRTWVTHVLARLLASFSCTFPFSTVAAVAIASSYSCSVCSVCFVKCATNSICSALISIKRDSACWTDAKASCMF